MGSPKGCFVRTWREMTDDSYMKNQEKKRVKFEKKKSLRAAIH